MIEAAGNQREQGPRTRHVILEFRLSGEQRSVPWGGREEAAPRPRWSRLCHMNV